MNGDTEAMSGAQGWLLSGPFAYCFLRGFVEWLGCKVNTRGREAESAQISVLNEWVCQRLSSHSHSHVSKGWWAAEQNSQGLIRIY